MEAIRKMIIPAVSLVPFATILLVAQSYSGGSPPSAAEVQPDESKVLAQINRIAQASAELEKTNGRMLLGFRGVLTQEQWKKLQTSDARHIATGNRRRRVRHFRRCRVL